MAIVFLIVGLIGAGIYHLAVNSGYGSKEAGAALIWGLLIVGIILEAILGRGIGIIIIFILVAGWVFS